MTPQISTKPQKFKIPKYLTNQRWDWYQIAAADDGPVVQLPGEPDLAEDGPGSTHYQMRVSAGGPVKARHMVVAKKICGCVIKLSQPQPKKNLTG